jgi:hypothetical protein
MSVTLTEEQVKNWAATLRNMANVLDPPAQQKQTEDHADDSQWHAAHAH